MRFDFESIIDRRGTGALAIDGLGLPGGFAPAAPAEGVDAIPMWVADMNFPAPNCITDAIIDRAKHPLFGYFLTADAYYDAIIGWHARRKGVTDIAKEHIGYENGVLGGVASAVACRQDLAAQPHLHRIHGHDQQHRAHHRAQPARARRGRRLAHGLRGHGAQAARR